MDEYHSRFLLFLIAGVILNSVSNRTFELLTQLEANDEVSEEEMGQPVNRLLHFQSSQRCGQPKGEAWNGY